MPQEPPLRSRLNSRGPSDSGSVDSAQQAALPSRPPTLLAWGGPEAESTAGGQAAARPSAPADSGQRPSASGVLHAAAQILKDVERSERSRPAPGSGGWNLLLGASRQPGAALSGAASMGRLDHNNPQPVGAAGSAGGHPPAAQVSQRPPRPQGGGSSAGSSGAASFRAQQVGAASPHFPHIAAD